MAFPKSISRKTFSLFISALVLGILLFRQVAPAADTLSPLEMQVFGKKYASEPVEARVVRLEKALGQSTGSNKSLSYRLNRLYQLQTETQSRQAKRGAIVAYNQGVDAANQRRYTEAIEAYQRAIRLNPDFIEAYNNLGNLFEQAQKFEDALLVYQQAIQRFPQEGLLYRNLGVVYEKMGNTTEALNAYRQYLKLTPDQPDETIAGIIRNYDAQHARAKVAPDYVTAAQSASDGQRLIWPESLIPIPVFISFEADQAPFLGAVRSAMDSWTQATRGRLRFEEVGSPEKARIKIAFQEGPLTHPYLEVGHASYTVPDDSPEVKARQMQVEITVNTGERDMPISLERRLEQVKRLALHEVGHAIGIWGHSTDPQDVMYARPIVSSLSQRDINTIRRLYKLDAASEERRNISRLWRRAF